MPWIDSFKLHNQLQCILLGHKVIDEHRVLNDCAEIMQKEEEK